MDKRGHLDILQCVQLEKFKKGQIVVREGERGDKFYIIIEGTAAVYVNNEGKASAVREYQLMEGRDRSDTLEQVRRPSARELQSLQLAGGSPTSSGKSRKGGDASPRFSPRQSLQSP